MLTKIKEHDFIINGAYSKILAMNNYLVIGDSITSPWAPAVEPKRGHDRSIASHQADKVKSNVGNKTSSKHTYQHRPRSRRLSQPETVQQCDYRRQWVHPRVKQPKTEQTTQETEPSRRKPKERMRKGRTFDT